MLVNKCILDDVVDHMRRAFCHLISRTGRLTDKILFAVILYANNDNNFVDTNIGSVLPCYVSLLFALDVVTVSLRCFIDNKTFRRVISFQ